MAVLSPAGRVVSLFGVSFFLVGFVNASALMYVVSFFCFAMLIAAFVLAHLSLRGVACRRVSHGSTIFSGDPLDGRLHITEARGRWRLLELLDQHTNLVTGEATHRRLLLMTEGLHANTAMVAGSRQPVKTGAGGERVTEVRDVIRFAQRGHYHLGPIAIRGYDPFGLLYVSRTIPTERELIVYPHPLPIPEMVLGGLGGRQNAVVRAVGRVGETADFHGIRPYVHGDDLRKVHWKATAHTGKLAIREFEYRSSGAVQVILDLQQGIHTGTGEFSTLEAAITLTSSILHHVVQAGNQAGLLTTGAQLVDLPPESGQRQLHRMLEALALAKGDGSLDLAQALAGSEGNYSRRSTAIVVTASTDTRIIGPLLALRGRAAQVLLVLLNPQSFHQAEHAAAAEGKNPLLAMAGKALASSTLAHSLNELRGLPTVASEEEHRALLQAAASSGIEVYPVGANMPLHQALQAIRMRM